MVCSTRHQPYDEASVVSSVRALAVAQPEHDGVEHASRRGRPVGLGSVEVSADRGNPVPQGHREASQIVGRSSGLGRALRGRGMRRSLRAHHCPLSPACPRFGDRHLGWRLSNRLPALYPTFYGARRSGR